MSGVFRYTSDFQLSTKVSDEEKQEIIAALRGEVAIPVYATEEGVKRFFLEIKQQIYA